MKKIILFFGILFLSIIAFINLLANAHMNLDENVTITIK